jgi:hypothetical protein
MQTQERTMPTAARLYERELPGGGYVAIDVGRRWAGDREVAVTRLCVERRQERDRRAGHEPPVIAELDGDERSPAFATMFQIARDNAAIARGLLDWHAERRARDD